MEEIRGGIREKIFHPAILFNAVGVLVLAAIFLFVQHSFAKSEHMQIQSPLAKKPAVITHVPIKAPSSMPRVSAIPVLAHPATSLLISPHQVLLPSPTPTPTPTPRPTADPTQDSVWDKLAQCESGGNWKEDTGNGYFGGLQFNQSAWESVGGSGKPSDASREDQIAKGKLLQSRRGWSPWGGCSTQLGF